MECHGRDDVEEQRKKEVKETFRGSDFIMGLVKTCPPSDLSHVKQYILHLLCTMPG